MCGFKTAHLEEISTSLKICLTVRGVLHRLLAGQLGEGKNWNQEAQTQLLERQRRMNLYDSANSFMPEFTVLRKLLKAHSGVLLIRILFKFHLLTF